MLKNTRDKALSECKLLTLGWNYPKTQQQRKSSNTSAWISFWSGLGTRSAVALTLNRKMSLMVCQKNPTKNNEQSFHSFSNYVGIWNLSGFMISVYIRSGSLPKLKYLFPDVRPTCTKFFMNTRPLLFEIQYIHTWKLLQIQDPHQKLITLSFCQTELTQKLYTTTQLLFKYDTSIYLGI